MDEKNIFGEPIEKPEQPTVEPVNEPVEPTEPTVEANVDEQPAVEAPVEDVEPQASASNEPQASAPNEPQPVQQPQTERVYAEVAPETPTYVGYGQQSGYGRPQQPQPQYQSRPMFDSNPYYRQQPQNFAQYPNYGYQPQPEPPKKKKRKGLRRLIAALVILAIIGGAAGTFVALYDVEFEDNGFSVIRRNFWERDDDTTTMRGDDESIYAQPSTEPNGIVSVEPAGDSGPELEIEDSPVTVVDYIDTDEPLTTQEIAAKCTDWTVGVIATTYYNASYYYGYGGAASSSGTGIIMSEDGYIITNHHVVEGATDLVVMMMDGTEYNAVLVGSDERSDLAVLKIGATGLPAAEFGDSDALMVGDPVVAIGNPLGLELMGTVTNGIVSAINRDVAVEERTMTLIQTNAAINSGNSGGPLINQYGQVIGINTLKMQDYSTTVEGLGFAIPTNTAKEIIDELIDKGYVSGYPAIGIRYSNVSESMANYYSIPVGVLVGYVYPESNAYAAGLQVNDVIVEAQGVEITDGSALIAMLEDYTAGDTFEIVVYHYDSRLYETITFELNDENDFVDGGTLIAP